MPFSFFAEKNKKTVCKTVAKRAKSVYNIAVKIFYFAQNVMAKDFEISRLCDAYGALLTENMCKAVREYYDYDMSLAEIGSENNITRQAVLCRLRQAEKKLKDYERAIGAVHRTDKLKTELSELLSMLDGDPDAAKSKLGDIINGLR